MKKWIVSELNKNNAKTLSEECNISAITAILLSLRGIKSVKEAESFLSDECNLEDPFILADMDKAVERITKAIDNFEEICIYGDYDADGVTSTTLLYSYLSDVGANVIFMIPDRQKDGYGLNKDAIDLMVEHNIKLIITVDNGITAHEEIKYASNYGIDTVVTDHHTPDDTLPPALAVINPHRKDCPSKFKYLCGVGVAFKLIMALEGRDCDIYSLLDNYADIVSIGTVGDIVTLTDENRFLVKYGTKCIANTERQGLLAMIDEAGVDPTNISAGDLAYTIVPRINALGRLGDTCDMVNFLLSDDDEYISSEVQIIGGNNRKRQEIGKEILENALHILETDPQIKHQSIIIVSGDDWHVGVIGIVAAKIKEIYGKPVIVISKTGDTAKGSCRSIEGFSICDALFYCKDLLTHCGGHPMAAGLSLNSENLEKFKEKILEYADNFDMPYQALQIDCKLKPDVLNLDLAYDIEKLEPFGAGNPIPSIGLYGVTLVSIVPVGGGKHLRLTLRRDGTTFTAMKFGTTINEFPYIAGDKLDIAVTVGVNIFNFKDNLSVIVKDIRFADADNEKMLSDIRVFERLMTLKSLTENELKMLLPDRDDFVELYKYIRSSNTSVFYVDTLCMRINKEKINCGKINVMLTAMKQLNLINMETFGNKYIINVNKSEKVNLEDAPIIKYITNQLKRR